MNGLTGVPKNRPCVISKTRRRQKSLASMLMLSSLYIASCSYANTTSQTLNTGMSEDGCPAVHVRWFDR